MPHSVTPDLASPSTNPSSSIEWLEPNSLMEMKFGKPTDLREIRPDSRTVPGNRGETVERVRAPVRTP